MDLSNKKIALIQGGEGLEKEISYKSSKAVAEALECLPCSYITMEADSTLFSQLKTEKPDIAFLGLHGIYGEDGCAQALCEFLKIPYTGSGVLSSAVCMDKVFFKQILMQNKIPTPEFHVLNYPKIPSSVEYPFVLKASHGGSSLGTFFIEKNSNFNLYFEKAKEIGHSVFIEKKISNYREVTVSFLDGKILTPIEIEPKAGAYDYKSKYEKEQTNFYLPPRLDGLVIKKLKLLAEKIFQLAKVRGYGRIDFLVEDNKIPWVMELNTLPGLTKTSLLPQSAEHDGIPFSQLIELILKNATTDHDFSKKA